MKKSIKTAIFATAVMAAGMGAYKAYDAYKRPIFSEDFLLSENVSALSEVTETKYIRTPDDCTIEAQAGTTVNLKMFGITIASANPRVNGALVFKDVQVKCSANGADMCTPRDCADFYVEVITAASGNDDDKSDEKSDKKEDKSNGQKPESGNGTPKP